MENIPKMDEAQPQEQQNVDKSNATLTGASSNLFNQQRQPPHLQIQKTKRKHRRGKPKSKNANKPYKTNNWNFQVPRFNYNIKGNVNANDRNRAKLERSRSLVPYNTNKFLMEEHLAEVPSALLTPSGRTRDSSFSVDSEDNYFFSLPEDEEEFLTKEFSNVYEKARVERLENLTKQELIEECMQIEDRYSKDQGTQHKAKLNVQRITAEFMGKIRSLEEKIRELTRENFNLRTQLVRSTAFAAAAAASPPSATIPTSAACERVVPMDSSSEDTESDSSSSSSSSSDGVEENGEVNVNGEEYDGGGGGGEQRDRRQSCSSRSSLSEYNGSNENSYKGSGEGGDIAEEEDNNVAVNDVKDGNEAVIDENMEEESKLQPNMEDDSNLSEDEMVHNASNREISGLMAANVSSPNKTNNDSNINDREKVDKTKAGQIFNEQ